MCAQPQVLCHIKCLARPGLFAVGQHTNCQLHGCPIFRNFGKIGSSCVSHILRMMMLTMNSFSNQMVLAFASFTSAFLIIQTQLPYFTAALVATVFSYGVIFFIKSENLKKPGAPGPNPWPILGSLPLMHGFRVGQLISFMHFRNFSRGVFTCSILASIVTILISIVVILTSIDPILEKCGHLQVQYSRVLSQHL